MSDFQPDDEVTVTYCGAVLTGTIVSVADETALVSTDVGVLWLPIYEMTLTYRKKQEPTHVCTPYVGPLFVERTCVYCNAYMTETEVSAYLKRIF